jgi:hypothetical protein
MPGFKYRAFKRKININVFPPLKIIDEINWLFVIETFAILY